MSYIPSPSDRRRFRRLLAKLTPGAGTYREYHERAQRYLDAHDLILPAVSHGGQLAAVTRLRMRKSELFGPEYLVAFVDSEWLRRVAPESDAIASTMLGPDLNSAPPPLVLVPELGRGHDQNLFDRYLNMNSFTSIRRSSAFFPMNQRVDATRTWLPTFLHTPGPSTKRTFFS